MSQQVEILRVLISSPSDVPLEREAALEVVHEVNRLLGSASLVRLEPVVWETDVAAGIGPDPQEVVNRQVGRFELFVGIMWTRLGSRTPRASSGTIEEFEHALARWREDASSVQVMFYFSDVPITPAQLDPQQLVAVHQFRVSLSEIGVLYKTYAALEEFKLVLRHDLMVHARDWPRRRERDAQAMRSSDSVSDEVLEDEEEYGPLDLLAFAEQARKECEGSLRNVTDETRKFASSISRHTAEIKQLTSAPRYSALRLRQLVNGAAADLTRYAEAVEGHLPIFSQSWATYVEWMAQLLSLDMAAQVPPERLQAARTQIRSFDQSFGRLADTLQLYRHLLAVIPPSTSSQRGAVRRASRVIGDMLEEIRKARGLLPNLLHSVGEQEDVGRVTDARRPDASPEEIENILRWFESADPVVRKDAAKELLQLVWRKPVFYYERVRGAMRRLLNDPEQDVRMEGLEIVRTLMVYEKTAVGRYYAKPVLNSAENDTSVEVRARVMAVIGATGDTYYLDRIYQWIDNWDEQTYRRVWPVAALTGLASAGLGERIRNDLRALIDQASEPIRQRYIEALKNVTDVIR